MRKFLLSVLVFASSHSLAASFTTDTALDEVAAGDTLMVCGPSACGEGTVISKVAVKDASKGTLEQVLANAKRLAVPGVALVVMTSLPAADGGPITAAVCAVTCEIISNAGCGAGAWITGTLNPAVGICYAAVCSVLSGSSAASCASVCAGLPTP